MKKKVMIPEPIIKADYICVKNDCSTKRKCMISTKDFFTYSNLNVQSKIKKNVKKNEDE